MELSVIIVNYNVRFYLEQCLYRVLRASEKAEAEIIVIDNNSSDDSCRMISMQYPQVKLIRNTSNEGFAKACNRGLKIAKGEYILLLNPDTLICEETFVRCITFMRDHPDAGALGVKMTDGSGKYLRESKRSTPYPLTALYKITGLSGIFPRSSLFSRYYMGHLDRDKISQVEVLTGAFMFIRKSTIASTGLLDESYFMYGEDIDFSFRILLAGYKIYYFPEVAIIHFKGRSSEKNRVKSILSFYMAMLIFTRKYFARKRPLIYYALIKPSIYLFAIPGIAVKLIRSFFASIRSAGKDDEKRYLEDLYTFRGPAIIAASPDSYRIIIEKIKKAGLRTMITGRIGSNQETEGEADSEKRGNIEDIDSIIKSHGIKAVIFSLKSYPIPVIMSSLNKIPEHNILKRIVPD